MIGNKSTINNIHSLGNKKNNQLLGIGSKIFPTQQKLTYTHISIPKVSQNVKKSILER